MKITDMRCEYRREPLGVAESSPRLSWVPQSEEPGHVQTAYHIQVSSSAVALATGRAELWDSGVVASADTCQIAYAGTKLKSRQRCFWRVRGWDGQGHAPYWSPVATWEMGLLEAADWRAAWIGGGGLLRYRFALDKPVVQARAYVTSLGFHELRLNGKKVGDQLLAPAPSHGGRVFYLVHDVAALLRQGDNVVGVMLGAGDCPGDPKLLLQLEVEHPDGSQTRALSGAAWSAAPGPVVVSAFHGGERHDARQAIPGWDTAAEAPGDSWSAATEADAPDEALAPQTVEPARAIRLIRPVAITHLDSGAAVYDLGESVVGWAQMTAKAPAGTWVKLRLAEQLDPMGRPEPDAQIDEYCCRGGGTEQWAPHFTRHFFRHVELSGPPEPPGSESITAVVVHSDAKRVGAFSCGSPLADRLYELVLRALPGRLRRAGGDLLDLAELSLNTYDVATLWSEWIEALEDGLGRAQIAWLLHAYYGDTRVLELQFPGTLALAERFSSVETAETPLSAARRYQLVKLAADTAAALGRTDNAASLAAAAAAFKLDFQRKFLPVGATSLGDQLVDALALALELAPENVEREMADALRDEVARLGPAHGFHGLGLLCGALSRHGHVDTAWETLAQAAATGLEPCASLASWFHQNLCGVRPLASAPGFKHFRVEPCFPAGLSHARVCLDSVRGRIEVSWRRQDGGALLRLRVPPNASATVALPSSDEIEAAPDGLAATRRRDGKLDCFTAVAGESSFWLPA